MAITLIGYRGTGKSTIGPRLADRLGWEFVDVDPQIERRAGRTIRDIFTTDGEDAFRNLEATVLSDLLARDRLVVAPGGGAVLRSENRDKMKTSGPVVLLTAPVDVILSRIQADATSHDRRPSLTRLPMREEIEQLLRQREPLYAEVATFGIDTTGRDVDSLVDEILIRLKDFRPKAHQEPGR
jgi:shikimate kinase